LIRIEKQFERTHGHTITTKTFAQGSDGKTKFYERAEFSHQGVLWEIKRDREMYRTHNPQLEKWMNFKDS
jgi:hypothetical protein